jgi:tellurite resistance protein
VTSTAETGDFYCPNCQGQQPYQHKRVRRFFSLYFIPVIPLDVHGEYVECEKCKGTYRMEVLDFDPAAGAAEFEVEFHRAIKRVMVEMMLADGTVDEEELVVIRQVYGQLAGRDITDDEVRKEIVEAETRSGDVISSLRQIAGNLNDKGKEMVIRAAFMVAAADGQFQDEEKELIGSIGQALEMSSAHLNGVISSVVQGE